MEKVGREGVNPRSFPDHFFCLCGLSSFFFPLLHLIFPPGQVEKDVFVLADRGYHTRSRAGTLKRAAQAQTEIPKEEINPVTVLDQNATFLQIWG